jgi:hypothetical protein
MSKPKVSMEQIERITGRVHGIVLYKNTLKAIIEVFLELGFEIEEVPEKGKGEKK